MYKPLTKEDIEKLVTDSLVIESFQESVHNLNFETGSFIQTPKPKMYGYRRDLCSNLAVQGKF